MGSCTAGGGGGRRAQNYDTRSYGVVGQGHGETPKQKSTWSGGLEKFRILLPYIWPKKDVKLQFNVLFCFLLLLGGRAINVLVPMYYKFIVDALGASGGTAVFCWQYVLIYVGLKFLQGGGASSSGFLNNMRSLMWISVQQYTSREVQIRLYSHLLGLSLRWHMNRQTGEVLRVMDRGTSSINNLLQYIIFNILPTIIDIIIAIVYFTLYFNYWFGLIILVTMITYLSATFAITEWRTKYRRSMNLADNEQRTKAVDSLLNYETVKYYGAGNYEVDRYQNAIMQFQVEEWKDQGSLTLLNTTQNFVINAGLLAGSLLAAWRTAYGEDFTAGDYILFATFIMQLNAPLNFFGVYYRQIQQNFIDMENMFDLLSEEQEVQDKKDALEVTKPEGRIEFKNVSFHYCKSKPVLKNVSFTVEPGKTIAIVGPSGGGKSTIMRLLFRFYDVISGSILVDNVDIKNYIQDSLRKAIGVVPQDTVLFNETIMYNIRYGKISSEDKECIEAAEHADINNKIITFPEQYETKVGERGLKLSGGEKQRVAIARTILKDPVFLLLDEATSALDTQTERNIQNALQKICAGRTVIIVAHRLSTIIHADTILVLKEGTVCERGTHQELLEKGNVYANMWQQQLETSTGQTNNISSTHNDSPVIKKVTKENTANDTKSCSSSKNQNTSVQGVTMEKSAIETKNCSGSQNQNPCVPELTMEKSDNETKSCSGSQNQSPSGPEVTMEMSANEIKNCSDSQNEQNDNTSVPKVKIKDPSEVQSQQNHRNFQNTNVDSDTDIYTDTESSDMPLLGTVTKANIIAKKHKGDVTITINGDDEQSPLV